jgi:hypothetical protein
MTDKPNDAPERIFLVDDPNMDGLVWCEDRVNDSDVEYIRADSEELVRLRRIAELVRNMRKYEKRVDQDGLLSCNQSDYATMQACKEQIDALLSAQPKTGDE